MLTVDVDQLRSILNISRVIMTSIVSGVVRWPDVVFISVNVVLLDILTRQSMLCLRINHHKIY